MKIKTDFRIGVVDHRFSLMDGCSKIPHHGANMSLSFSLSGDFLSAALTDDIACAVDYDELSVILERALSSARCGSLAQSLKEAKNAIAAFSSTISDGCITVTMCCHNTFTESLTLL